MYRLLLFFIILLNMMNSVYGQYNKLSGTLEMYYKTGNTTSTNGNKLSSYSDFTKRISLQYPFFLWDPGLVIVTPSVGIYDAGITTTSYDHVNGKEKGYPVDNSFKNYEYSLSSRLFSNNGFPLSVYMNRLRNTKSKGFLSINTNDTITATKGLTWSFDLNKYLFTFLPLFSMRYSIRDIYRGDSEERERFSETADYNFSKTYFYNINVNYNYSILETGLYKYKYHKLKLRSRNQLSKATALTINANYDSRDELKYNKTYNFNSFLRYNPDKTLHSFLRYDLRISDHEDVYRQIHRVDVNNIYRKYLMGSANENQNIIFNQRLDYRFSYVLTSFTNTANNGQKGTHFASHGISSSSGAVYEKKIYGVFLKPGYTLGLGYGWGSADNDNFNHSHNFAVGADNRGFKYFLVNADVFYQIGSTHSKKTNISTQSYGYNHSISSRYIKKMTIIMPLKYQIDIRSDNTRRTLYSTDLIVGYEIIRNFNARSRTGYYFTQDSNYTFKSLRAEQKLTYKYSSFDSNLILLEEQRLRDNNVRENVLTFKFITRYVLSKSIILLEYNYSSRDDHRTEFFSFQIKRSI